MKIEQEILRKTFHLNLLLFPIFFSLLGKDLFLKILFPTSILIIAFDSLRKINSETNFFFTKIFGKIMRPEEIQGKSLSGMSWTFLSACIVFSFSKPAIAVNAFLILAISDSLAAIVGKSLASKPFFEKSIAGSSAFFASAVLVSIICGIAYNCKFSFYLFAIVVSAIVTLLEARPSLFNLDDNFSIPVFFAFFMTFLNFMWHFA